MSTKKCTKCKKDLPLESFKKEKRMSNGLSSQCRECINRQKREHAREHREENKARCKQYYHEHKERNNAYCKQYRLEHRENISEQRKRHYRENKETIRERQKEYIQANREKVAAQQKRYATMHKERLTEYWKQYYIANREKKLVYQKQYAKLYSQTQRGKETRRIGLARRREHLKNAGSHTVQEIQEQLDRQRHRCYYCKVKLGEKRSSYHTDHVIPLSRGGSNDISNIVLTCRTCNLRKGNKLLHEWLDAGRLF